MTTFNLQYRTVEDGLWHEVKDIRQIRMPDGRVYDLQNGWHFPKKRFRFELSGGAFTYYEGKNLGVAIEAFIKHRHPQFKDIESITEE